jgi:hypothetical protein
VTLEALRCTNCGSHGVDEVKAGTYFCQHCESVFKYVDPSRVTVTHEQSFCACGNAVEFQCYQCRTGICHQHDAFDGGKKVGQAVRAFVAEKAGAVPPHLCSDCLNPLMTELHTLKDERRRCAQRECIDETTVECACCAGAFCGHHADRRTFIARWGTGQGEEAATNPDGAVCDACTSEIGRALGMLQPAPAKASRRAVRDVRADAEADAMAVIGRVDAALAG